MAGLEVEFHVFKLEDAHMPPEDAGQPGTPPDVTLLSHGYQYLTEQRYDRIEPALEICGATCWRSACRCARWRSSSARASSSSPLAATGLAPADTMVLFRSAVKQIARRHGYHATFMCRPRMPNVIRPAGTCTSRSDARDGENAFMAKDEGRC